MTDKVEQIRNEVKRLLNEPAPSHDSQCNWEDGYWCALYKIEEFIDSLQEEPISDDLEEAAKNHAVERYRTTRDRELAEKCKWSFISGAKWNRMRNIINIKL